MSDPINTPTNLPDVATNVPTAGGGSADVISVKDLLNAELGKEFKTDADALKGVKDTFSYVGKVGKFMPKLDALQQKFGGEANLIKTMDDLLNGAGTPAQPTQPSTPDNSNFVTREEMEQERFFDKNADYAPHRDLLTALVKNGQVKTLQEAVELPAFKTLFEKAQAGDKIEKSKSVMQSNSRLGAVTDKFTQAAQMAKDGQVSKGAETVTDAVIEAFNLDK